MEGSDGVEDPEDVDDEETDVRTVGEGRVYEG